MLNKGSQLICFIDGWFVFHRSQWASKTIKIKNFLAMAKRKRCPFPFESVIDVSSLVLWILWMKFKLFCPGEIHPRNSPTMEIGS